MSRRASYREGLSYGILTFGALAVLGIASSVVIARIYGIQVLGQYALALSAAGILIQVSSLQEQRALVRELSLMAPRDPRVTGLFVAVMVFSGTLTAVATVLVGAGAALVLSGPVGRPDLVLPALVLLAEYLFISNTSWNFDMVFAAFRAGRQLFWVRLLQALAFLCVAVGAGLAWGTLWGLVLAQFASTGTGLLCRVVLARAFMTHHVSLAEIRSGLRFLPEIVRFGAKMAPGHMADGLEREAGTWILGITASVAAVGAWSRAWMLGWRLVQANFRVTEMLFPTLLERRARADTEGFDRATVDTLRYIATGLLLPAAVGGGAAYGIMRIFGPGFDRAADALAIILLFPALYGMGAVMAQVLLAFDRPALNSVVSIVRSLISVALMVALSLLFGVTGIALAMLVGLIVGFGARAVAASSHLETSLFRQWPFRKMASVVLAYVAGFGVSRTIDTALSGVPGLLAALAAGTLVYIGVLLATRGLTERDRERVREIRTRMLARRRSSKDVDPPEVVEQPEPVGPA